MRAIDIILGKRAGEALSEEQIRVLVDGYVAGTIPDYQVAAWLMAVYFRGMTPEETGFLTRAMIDSGDVMSIPNAPGPLVDKHSTGGVGDKVSLILAPLAAACGLAVPMMSGRALGHTGGTLDKLDAIPGYRTRLEPDEFASIVRTTGFAMTGQTDRVVPADRLMYALRDVTGTVESVPLITASILSKKFAEGADALVFDVKAGPGAFMSTLEDARVLADSLVSTGESLGKRIVAVLTRMDWPLGSKVGNFLEVEESLALLNAPMAVDRVPVDGRSDDLLEVTVRLTAWMLVAGALAPDVAAAEERCRQALADGSAWRVAEANIAAQGGNLRELAARLGTLRAPVSVTVDAPYGGTLTALDAHAVGRAGVAIGVGRATAADSVHPDVGFEVLAKPGDSVAAGSPLVRIWGHTDDAVAEAHRIVAAGIAVDPTGAAMERPPMIYEEVGPA